jgi:hypothetical protein
MGAIRKLYFYMMCSLSFVRFVVIYFSQIERQKSEYQL